MSAVAGALTWVASGAGALGGALAAAAVQPVLLIPALVLLTPLATLPLLVPVLTLVALYSRDPDRQGRAAKILDRLLTTLQGGKHTTDTDPADAGPVQW